MREHFRSVILEATGASDIFEIGKIQSLWSGYGSIVRYGLIGAKVESVVVKHVQLNQSGLHPRGWNTGLSHQRKMKSYQVETAWYEQYAHLCSDFCRIPGCFALELFEDEVFMVLEDLDASGFGLRKNRVNKIEMQLCLQWLANFHATFMGAKPDNLWEVGTYWHLDTRPDELKVLNDISLKKAAPAIDKRLSGSPFQTLVHGDAKLANFCFSVEGQSVAAVDFQYVGGGCGMKDVAYFIGSCLNEEECEKQEAELLDYYFDELVKALCTHKKDVDTQAMVNDWRKLFPVAWADFHRFIKGWSPGHWKINTYSEKIARKVVNEILN